MNEKKYHPKKFLPKGKKGFNDSISERKVRKEYLKPLFPKGKKGFNDMVILAISTSILLLASFIIPNLNAAFGTSGSEFDTDNLQGNIQEEAESVSSISAFGILVSFIKLALWDVGNTLNLPVWLDLFFTLLFIVMLLTIARNIWIGGGS